MLYKIIEIIGLNIANLALIIIASILKILAYIIFISKVAYYRNEYQLLLETKKRYMNNLSNDQYEKQKYFLENQYQAFIQYAKQQGLKIHPKHKKL